MTLVNPQTRTQIERQLKLGNTVEALVLLADVIRQYPRDEEAWLTMAGIVDDPDQKRDCLSRVLSINPKNESAWQLLAELSIESGSADLPPEEAGQPARRERPRLRRVAPRPRRAPVPTWMWAALVGAVVFAMLVCAIGGFWYMGGFKLIFPPTPIPDTPTGTFPTLLPSDTPTPVTPTATLFRLPTYTSTPNSTPIPSGTAPAPLLAAGPPHLDRHP